MMTSDCSMDELLGNAILQRDDGNERDSPHDLDEHDNVSNDAKSEGPKQYSTTATQSPSTNDDEAIDCYTPSTTQLLQSVMTTETDGENNDTRCVIDSLSQQHIMEMEMEPNDTNNNIGPSFQQHAMELNVALEALEAMRRANLTVEFSLAASSFPLRHDKCTFCQRQTLHKFLAKPKDVVKSGSDSANSSSSSLLKLDGSHLRSFHSSVGSYFYSSKAVGNEDVAAKEKNAETKQYHHSSSSESQSNASLSSADAGVTKGTTDAIERSSLGSSNASMLKKVYPFCLTCGHPTCATHSSASLSKNRVTICQSCAYLYELDYLVETIRSSTASSNPAECQQKVNDMIDCYDRAKLLLEYAAEYAEDIASALENNKARSNKIGVGSSASGIVSGVTGVIGCGALFFPPVAVAGVPLLIASFVFGTGATTVSTGDAAVRQFFSEPNRLANKMFALHGMVVSLSRITDILRTELSSNSESLTVMCSRDDVNEIDEEKKEERKSPMAEEDRDRKISSGNDNVAIMDGGTASFVPPSKISPSKSSVVGRSTRYLGRVCTTASSSISFIPIVGGVLSGASIYFEGKELKRTLSKISEGNPCAKAERVRAIKDQLAILPDSKSIAAECRRMMERAHR